jgi:hypothetical protein
MFAMAVPLVVLPNSAVGVVSQSQISIHTPTQSVDRARTYAATLPVPPRIQWNENFGYCGEVSFISAGLYYGQYLSQYDARAIASKRARQNLPSSQLLLGVNDVYAARAMHLSAVAFNTATQTNSKSFLTWVKTNIKSGYPVAIGVFANQSRFNDSTDLNAGETENDHIVLAPGIRSTPSLKGKTTYYDNDILAFNDHGLWTGTVNSRPQNVFSYSFGTFTATRQVANAPHGSVYSLRNGKDYAIAFTGVIDRSHETLPVRLSTNINVETPEIVENSSVRPAARPMRLTIKISGLRPNVAYNLYRYSSLAAVPESNFNAKAASAAHKWVIRVSAGSSYTTTQTINSNEVAVYRAVPAAGP